jgi:hypothetical protein
MGATPAPSQNRWDLQANPLRADIKLLFLSALIVFIVTVAIGLLNGQHVVTLSSDVILTHVHAGTLGWITLSVFAFGFWIFGNGGTVGQQNTYIRVLSIVSAIAIPLYVISFFLGIAIIRAVISVPVLLAMVGILAWIIAKSTKVRLTVAHIAMLESIVTLIIGAILGVLIQIQTAAGTVFLPDGVMSAHPATMVAGYLILIGMGLSEWRLMPASDRLSRLGVVQVTLLFLAGIVLMIAALLNIPPLYGLNALLEVVGVIIFIIRFAPRVIRVNWTGGRDSSRFFAISACFVVVNAAMTIYLTVSLVTGAFPNGNIPSGLLIALDHATFIGVMTNALFGLIQDATQEQRSFWPWAEDILFWGMNFGALGFIITLLTGTTMLERVFTPIMGLSILLGIATYSLRLRRPPAIEQAGVSISQP